MFRQSFLQPHGPWAMSSMTCHFAWPFTSPSAVALLDQCQRSCPASASSPKRGDGQGVPRKGNQSPIVPIFLRQRSRHVSFVWSWGNMTWYINISRYIIYYILYWLKLVRCVSKPNLLKRHHWWRPKRGISAVVEELFHIEADKESHVSAVKGKVAAVAGLSGKLRVILFGKEPPMIWSEDRGAKEQPTKTGSILYYTMFYYTLLYYTLLYYTMTMTCLTCYVCRSDLRYLSIRLSLK